MNQQKNYMNWQKKNEIYKYIETNNTIYIKFDMIAFIVLCISCINSSDIWQPHSYPQMSPPQAVQPINEFVVQYGSYSDVHVPISQNYVNGMFALIDAQEKAQYHYDRMYDATWAL